MYIGSFTHPDSMAAAARAVKKQSINRVAFIVWSF